MYEIIKEYQTLSSLMDKAIDELKRRDINNIAHEIEVQRLQFVQVVKDKLDLDLESYITSNADVKERRKFKRAIFTVKDSVVGTLNVPSFQEKSITAYILNLSRQGMCFTLKTDEKNKIRKGDNLVLIQVKGSPSLKFFVNIDTEIKWIIDYPIFEQIGLGCEFQNVPSTSRSQLGAFVDSWHAERRKQ